MAVNIKADSHQMNESELFNINGNTETAFNIPSYQRPYVWKKNNWDDLFSDIRDNEPGYFVGAIICVDRGLASNDKYLIHEVVDGQQRLTTLSLFFAAIYTALEVRKTKLEDTLDAKELINFWFSNNYNGTFSAIKKQLTIKTARGKIRSRILPQNKENIDDYLQVMLDAGLLNKDTLDYDEVIKADKRRLIPKAYEYFRKSVEEYAGNGDVKQQIVSIVELLDKLNAAMLVMIKASSHASANTLFEALNNRGVPLTITDLIKNRLLAELSNPRYKTNFKKYHSQWKDAIKIFTRDDKEIPGIEQERFFRQSYNAYRTSWESIDENGEEFSLDIGKRTTLYPSYEKMLGRDPKRVLEQIVESAKIYPRIQGYEAKNLTSDLHEAYLDLRRINGATSYTLLLYLVKNRKELNLNSDSDFEKICRLLIKFFVRHSFTDSPASNKLDGIFIGFIGEIEGEKYVGAKIYDELLVWLKNEYGADDDDEKFKAALRRATYGDKSDNDDLRFVLAKLACTQKVNPDFWQTKSSKKKRDRYVWTIEHILPQTLKDAWIMTLANGDKEKAEAIKEKYCHKIGNLTLTAYNGELSNRPFEEKKKIYQQDKLDDSLNADVLAQDEWTPIQIDARTKLLADKISEVFAW